MCHQKDLGRDKIVPCKNKSVVYQSSCLICRKSGKRVTYTGETGRGVEERLGEHLRDGVTQDEKSHIHQHLASEHPETLEEKTTSDPMDLLKIFEFKALHTLPKALHRQIMEALVIGRETREGAVVLNQKQEYNRCLLPEILIKDTRPTANISGPLSDNNTPEQVEHLGDTLEPSLEDTQKRDTRKADIREKVRQRKRRKIEKDNRKEKHSTTEPRKRKQDENQTENNNQNYEHYSQYRTPESTTKKRKLSENTQTNTQNSTPDSQISADSLKEKQPVQPDEHPNPVTTKAKTNPPPSTKSTSNCKRNQQTVQIIKGKRRTRERGHKKDTIKTNDIRSFFHSLGDRLTNRGTQQGEVHAESKRIQANQDQQVIPGDPAEIEPSRNSDHHLTVDL